MASNNSVLCNIGLHLFDVVKTIGKLGCILNGAMELLELKITVMFKNKLTFAKLFIDYWYWSFSGQW